MLQIDLKRNSKNVYKVKKKWPQIFTERAKA